MKLWRRSWTGAAGVLAAIAVGLLPSLGFGADNGQITTASRQVHDAQAQVNQARQQMGRARIRIAAAVEGKPQWSTAVKEFRGAQAAFAAVKKQALAAVVARSPADTVPANQARRCSHDSELQQIGCLFVRVCRRGGSDRVRTGAA